MLIFQRMVLIFLLARCNPGSSTTSPSSTASTSTDVSELSTNPGRSTMTVVTSSTVSYHSEMSTTRNNTTQSNATTLPDTGQTTQQLDYSTEDTTQTFTSENRMSSSSEMSSPSEMPTTTSNLSTISQSYANTMYTKPSEAASSFTTTTYEVSFTTMVSTTDAQNTGVTAPPNDTTSAISLTTSSNGKTVLSEQTTRLDSSSTNSEAETHAPKKDNDSNAGVIVGAIVGAVLGSALIGLVGYFMCKKRKSEGFAHQRLYDDTRNDPVLRLDNAPESYGENFANLSNYNPTIANETIAKNSNIPPYDAIPMDDMTLSPHLP